MRLRPDGALLQSPAVPVGDPAAPGDPRADGARARQGAGPGALRSRSTARRSSRRRPRAASTSPPGSMPFVVLALGSAVGRAHAAALAARRRAPGGARRWPPCRRPASSARTSARSSASWSASTADAPSRSTGGQLAARRRRARLRRLAAAARSRSASAPREPDCVSPLERQKLDAYAAIKEAEFDRRMGKLSDEDFTRADAALPPAGAGGDRRRSSRPSAPRPRAAAARRCAWRYCPSCGEKLAPRANFCSHCGRSLRETAA